MNSKIKKILLYAIDIYRNAISPYLPSSCRFTPTCSAYSREAIERYGILKGIFVSMKRILRCHPFNRGGYDPIR